MADNITVLNSGSTVVTVRSTDVGGGIQGMMSIPADTSGNALFGQKTMGASVPVTIASNQSSITAVVSGTVTSVLSNPITAVVSGTVTSVLSNPITAVISGSITGTVTAVVSGTTVVSSITAGTVTAVVSGDIASGSSDSGNPVKLGAVAHTAIPSAVGDGQRVNLIADKVGKLIAVGAIRNSKATQITSLTTAAETTIVNAINATTFADMFGVILANTGSTTSKIDIRYGLGSAVVMSFEVPATDTRGFMVPVDSAIPCSLSTANLSWTAQLAATTNMSVTVFYVQNI